MLTSKIFTFNEENFKRDIAEYGKFGTKEITKIQCNMNTYRIWCGMLNPALTFHMKFADGVGAAYNGVPIEINNNLSDGIVVIQ